VKFPESGGQRTRSRTSQVGNGHEGEVIISPSPVAIRAKSKLAAGKYSRLRTVMQGPAAVEKDGLR
jgi:hypothetical protein